MEPIKPGHDEIRVDAAGHLVRVRIGQLNHGTRYTDLQPDEARRLAYGLLLTAESRPSDGDS